MTTKVSVETEVVGKMYLVDFFLLRLSYYANRLAERRTNTYAC